MMGVGQATGASRAVDIGAAAIFAGAIGYSILLTTASDAGAAAAAAAGFITISLALGRIDEPRSFRLPEFGLLEPAHDAEDALLLTELAELLLTDIAGGGGDLSSELLLEDRLDQPKDDSRVIRLFDPRALPTAGEMHERIEEHLRGEQAAYPDATAELHRALSDLRRSLR